MGASLARWFQQRARTSDFARSSSVCMSMIVHWTPTQQQVVHQVLNTWSVCSWTVPSSIPVGAFDGNSLFGLLNGQIAKELAHFPTGPSIDSPFWLYLVVWHVGLFTTMLLGQVGVNGRKQGYW